jgi:TH1 protein
LWGKQAVDVVEGCLTAMGNKELELQKALVECGVRLLLAGHVEACLGMAERWSRNADQSVVRYMAARLLSCCAPPYSAAFALSVFKCGPRRARHSPAPCWSPGVSRWGRWRGGTMVGRMKTRARARAHTHTHTHTRGGGRACDRAHIYVHARTRPPPPPTHTHTHIHMLAHTKRQRLGRGRGGGWDGGRGREGGIRESEREREREKGGIFVNDAGAGIFAGAIVSGRLLEGYTAHLRGTHFHLPAQSHH